MTEGLDVTVSVSKIEEGVPILPQFFFLLSNQQGKSTKIRKRKGTREEGVDNG